MHKSMKIILGCTLLLFFFIMSIGYWGTLLQLIYSKNKTSDIITMWPHNTQRIMGSYAFHQSQSVFFWTVFGLYRINLNSRSIIIYNDSCSFEAVLEREKYTYTDGIQSKEKDMTSFPGFKKFRPGAPIVFQLNPENIMYVSIFNYIPEAKARGKLICI